MAPPIKISSGFALIDVKNGRSRLHKAMLSGHRVPVTITGYITEVWGNDDGTSRGFVVSVESATCGEISIERIDGRA